MNLPKHKIPIVEIPSEKKKTFHQKEKTLPSRNFWK